MITDRGDWTARALVNATGTWDSPIRPSVPGQEAFTGSQWHTADPFDPVALRGRRVAVVGGGISAIQALEEISRVADTRWYTRRPPVFAETAFDPETTGRATIAKVAADVEAGRPVGSIVGYTGLHWSADARAARDRGVLVRHPMFTGFTPHGVREADGSVTPIDAVVWATGYRPSIRHLAPLGLEGPRGGVALSGTMVRDEPRVHLVGYGPSQSTVGANRAGRASAVAIHHLLRQKTRAHALPAR